jgi:hypothetical protein
MSSRHRIAFTGLLLAQVALAPLHADEQASPPTPNPASTPAPAARDGKDAVAKEAPKEPAPPPSVTIIGAQDAHGVLGRDVRSSTGQDMGRIVDVIVDLQGSVRAAVIDFGGFLGVGSRKIVVDWSALNFTRLAAKSESITLDLTKEQVNPAPEYKEDKPVVVLGAAGKLSPWDPDH